MTGKLICAVMPLARLCRALITGLATLAALTALTALSPATHAAITLQVQADMRAEISAGRFHPERDGLGLRGSHPPLSWQQGLPMLAIGDGRYAVQVVFADAPHGGQPLQYKFRIERPQQGPDQGWEGGRNRTVSLESAGASVARAFNTGGATDALRRTGHIDHWGEVASAHVGAREVQVWLPPGYAGEPLRRYPVLYLHDGQNVFDAAAAGAEWQVDETAQRLVLAGAIAPPIIVAVSHGADRALDYTPSRMRLPAERTGLPNEVWMGGGLAAYGRFLADELKPQVDARYRTRTGPADTAVGGSSLGGVASLWLALHRGDVFGAALVVSPSLWWDGGLPLRQVQDWRGPTPTQPRPRLWLDMGAHEGAGAVLSARALRLALQERGWKGGDLHYVEDPRGSHDEASWALRVEGMLRFLYPATATPISPPATPPATPPAAPPSTPTR